MKQVQAAAHGVAEAAENNGPMIFARIGTMQTINRHERVHLAQNDALGKAQAQEGRAMTVWIYVDTVRQIGDVDHLKVFADADATDRWFAENDPEGAAFEYPVVRSKTARLSWNVDQIERKDRRCGFASPTCGHPGPLKSLVGTQIPLVFLQ
jgi:hypothetical protein